MIMKTTFKNLLMLITMLSVSINAFADWDFKVDNIYYEITDQYDNIVKVTHGGITQGYFTPYESSYSGDIVIPEQVSYNGETYTVNGIGTHAFHRCSELTSVKMPDTVGYIGQGAFYYCTGITSITILEGVSSIGSEAFFYCENLESVTIPSSISNIGNEAFFSCNNLKAVYASDLSSWCKITFWDEYANPLCDSGNLYINGSLVNDIIIPNDITEIKNYTFYNCDNLASVSMQNNVTLIGESAFRSCTNLASVNIPNSVTSIGESAFSSCTNLASVNIPNSVTSIGKSAFEYCSNLESVKIPNRVKFVEPYTFNKCNLKTIVLGVEVNTIENRAFYSTNLTDITSLNPKPPHFYNDSYNAPKVSDFFGYVADKATLYVPKEALKSYMNSDVWKEFRKIKAIENGNVRDVADDAVNVSAKEGNIVVNGTDNAVITVYNTNGQLVYSGTDNVINVPSKGIYIVRVSGQTFKVIL